MDKYEFRRLAFKALVESKGKNGAAAIAKETGISQSYVSRMLATAEKAGRRKIADDMIEKLNSFYPGWLDIDLYAVTDNPFLAKRKSNRDKVIHEIMRLVRETDEAGLEVVLHSATLMQEKFPLAQQTLSSQ